MAFAAHCAGAAIAAAGGSSLPFVPDQLHDDAGYQTDQKETDKNRSQVFHDCVKHKIIPFPSAWWLPGTF